MNKKIILSLIGLAALVVPVVLLLVFTSNKDKQPDISSGERQINPKTVQEVVDKAPAPPPVVLPSPQESLDNETSPSADLEIEGSPSAQ